MENFKVGALAKYGLGYEELHAKFPRLIYCSITGFGQTGPYAPRPGYDSLIQAMGGVMSLTGEPDGLPQKVGVPVADLFAGLYGCIGILAALRHRDATGQGQQIDIGMLDTHVAWLANQGMNYLATGENPARLGNQHPNIVPYQVFPTADGHIVLSVGNDPTFKRFCEAFALTHLLEDARFATNAARVENRQLVTDTLTPVMQQHPTGWWVDRLEALKIGCGPINKLSEVFADPHVVARDMVREMAHGSGETVKVIANPVRLSETPPDYRIAAAAARRAHRCGAGGAAWVGCGGAGGAAGEGGDLMARYDSPSPCGRGLGEGALTRLRPLPPTPSRKGRGSDCASRPPKPSTCRSRPGAVSHGDGPGHGARSRLVRDSMHATPTRWRSAAGCWPNGTTMCSPCCRRPRTPAPRVCSASWPI